MDEPDTEADAKFLAYAIIACCAIMALFLLGFSLGYEIGKDIGRGSFG